MFLIDSRLPLDFETPVLAMPVFSRKANHSGFAQNFIHDIYPNFLQISPQNVTSCDKLFSI